MRLIVSASRAVPVLIIVIFATAFSAQLAASQPVPAGHGFITSVKVSPAYFNPSLGQKETIKVTFVQSGSFSVTIVDRDHFPIRRLVRQKKVAKGDVTLTWDGKDDNGVVVPDEAYTLKVDFQSGKRIENYDPAKHFTPVVEEVKNRTYSRQDGILAYTLEHSARVHIQAGQAVVDPKTGVASGPIYRTIADREPRLSGSAIETWSGYDESGMIYVPGLPNFVVSILATTLPENAILAVGNRRITMVQYARSHRSKLESAPRKLQAEKHAHHAGLNVFEDLSPTLKIEPAAEWDAVTKRWKVTGSKLGLTISVKDEAGFFTSQPGEIMVFIDQRKVATVERPVRPVKLTLGDDQPLPIGDHELIVNWVSKLGPVAIAATQIHVADK